MLVTQAKKSSVAKDPAQQKPNQLLNELDTAEFFGRYFAEINRKITDIDPECLKKSVNLVMETHARGNKIMIVGNGGSAAMASHLSVDFLKSAKVRAMNFNEADLITCFSNDYGYAHWVAKAFEMYADEGDLAIVISSSGQSPNMLNAAKSAREMRLKVLTVSGFQADNPLRQLGDVNLWADSSVYNTVEMTHHIWLLAVVDYVAQLIGVNN